MFKLIFIVIYIVAIYIGYQRMGILGVIISIPLAFIFNIIIASVGYYIKSIIASIFHYIKYRK